MRVFTWRESSSAFALWSRLTQGVQAFAPSLAWGRLLLEFTAPCGSAVAVSRDGRLVVATGTARSQHESGAPFLASTSACQVWDLVKKEPVALPDWDMSGDAVTVAAVEAPGERAAGGRCGAAVDGGGCGLQRRMADGCGGRHSALTHACTWSADLCSQLRAV